ncbi:MAG TPA: sigma-70 family RNA polymerase sigma factor [Pyrinomonadaceae bacterium]|nr:sigma-70 family RNA polymerase sigma factor [Pyrinomonadaceae bacterium]
MSHLEVFAEYRSYLFTLAYRMLGSVMDAEDLLQETFLRWQQASLATIRSPKAFLSTVVKNLCLNHLQSARVRREECSDSPELESSLPEPLSDPVNDEILADSLTSAFLVLLERLSPKERAVFLLREVFDCEYDEIAEIIRKNAVTCRQMLRRAKQHIRLEHSRFVASPEQLEALIQQFTSTCATGDLKSFVSALA